MIKSQYGSDESSDQEYGKLQGNNQWEKYVQGHQKIVEQHKARYNQLQQKIKVIQDQYCELTQQNKELTQKNKELTDKIQVLTWQNQISRQKITKFKNLSPYRKHSLNEQQDEKPDPNTEQILRSLEQKRIQKPTETNQDDAITSQISTLKQQKNQLLIQRQNAQSSLINTLVEGLKKLYTQNDISLPNQYKKKIESILLFCSQRQKEQEEKLSQALKQNKKLNYEVAVISDRIKCLQEEQEINRQNNQKANIKIVQSTISNIAEEIQMFFKHQTVSLQYQCIWKTLKQELQSKHQEIEQKYFKRLTEQKVKNHKKYTEQINKIMDVFDINSLQNAEDSAFQNIDNIIQYIEDAINPQIHGNLEKVLSVIKNYVVSTVSRSYESGVKIGQSSIQVNNNDQKEDAELVRFNISDLVQIVTIFMQNLGSRQSKVRAKFIINQKLHELIYLNNKQ